MKNLLCKIKTKSFWLSLISGVILILQNFGVKVNVPYVNEIVESVCALMLLLGVFTAPVPDVKNDCDAVQDQNLNDENSDNESEDKNSGN